MQHTQDPIPPSFDSLKKHCPQHMLYGNCAHKVKNDGKHPTITKPLKKKLKFKKKEFKPSESIKKKISQIEKKNLQNKKLIKDKMRLKAQRVPAFVPSQGYREMGSAFSKKKAPQSSQPGVKKIEYQDKLAQLKNCPCCKGNYMGCNNSSMCMGLGQCYCKMHFDMENEQPDDEDENQNFNLGNVFPAYSNDFGISHLIIKFRC